MSRFYAKSGPVIVNIGLNDNVLPSCLSDEQLQLYTCIETGNTPLQSLGVELERSADRADLAGKSLTCEILHRQNAGITSAN